MDFSNVLSTMFRLCAAMVVGYVLGKMKVLRDETNVAMSGLIINVTSPALVIYSVCQQSAVSPEVVGLVIFGAALYALLPLLAGGVARLLRPGMEADGIYRLLLVFGNVSFMGFPVAQAVFGEQAIFYMNLLNIPFSLLMFSYGVRLVKKSDAQTSARERWKAMINPGFVSGVISLIIYFARVPMPALATSTLGFLGGVTTPLSMIVIGSMIAELPLGELLTERKLFLLSVFRLMVFPALGFLVARLLFSDPVLVGVVTISLGMPGGTMCAMVSRQYGTAAQADTAAKGVFLTTALSVITLPLMILLMA